MSIELNKLAAEFNRYFTSSNGIDVPAKVSVSRDEWRELFAAIQQAEAQQPATAIACGIPAWVVSTAKEVVLNLGPQEVILRYVTESDTKRAHGVMLTAAKAKKGQP